MATTKAFICGCSGPRLTEAEADFLAAERPFGLILFQRNCPDRDTVRRLVADFRRLVGRADAPVLIDQEGGRVQRLKPPEWTPYPPAGLIGRMAAVDSHGARRTAWLQGRLIAADLAELGIDVDCAPVLDVPVPGASDAVGDRAFASDPATVVALARAFAAGLADGGVVPIVKHAPGQGRATVDSHRELPVVGADLATLDASDFVPFRELADLPIAMIAHVVYRAVDSQRPATTSPVVIRDIIRARINFAGLLVSDDVSMDALSGDYGARARAIYDAGCDIVLHCNGRTEEMRAVADAAPVLAGPSGERARRALLARAKPKPFDRSAAFAELTAALTPFGWNTIG